jgi:hypothetical protein
MRFALGTAEPARFITFSIAQRFTPFGASAGFGGAPLSATSTSPLGSTCTHRGCCRSRA